MAGEPYGNGSRYWEPPTPRIAELLRTAVEMVLVDPESIYRVIDEASLAAAGPPVAVEPGVAEAIRACVRANLGHWCAANLHAPGVPVSANLSAENVDLARAVVRHGFDEMLVTNFHAGQNAAVRTFTQFAFLLSTDPHEIRELLDLMMASIFAFVDATLTGVFDLIQRERRQLADLDHTERMETINLVLAGAPIGADRAARRLGYPLDGPHLAAIVWSDSYPLVPEALDAAADALARMTGAAHPLTVTPSPATLWVWVPAATRPDPDLVHKALESAPGTRMALGSIGSGAAGFRRSHLDAVATQRLMRRLRAPTRLATYDEVEVVALTADDEERAHEFVTRTLGDLIGAEPELLQTLRVYLQQGWNAARTARILFAHRNTIVYRLDRARALLPRPLEHSALQVALALEIVSVLGRTAPVS
ncbi:helix-turn-helix domain-containing protein [Nocardia sp. NPDC003482]